MWQPTRSAGPPDLRDAGATDNKNEAIHRWVPWIAGYSAHFVEDVIRAYLPETGRGRALVLDPFAGVGTTLIEALKGGCNAVGYEINGFAALAGRAKVGSTAVPVDGLWKSVARFRSALARQEGAIDSKWAADPDAGLDSELETLASGRPQGFKSRVPFFSPPVEAKFLRALRLASVTDEPGRGLIRTALGATMVSYSNYSYEPSLSSRPGAGKPLIENASVAQCVGQKLDDMLHDIQWAQQAYGLSWGGRGATLHHGSYFNSELKSQSVSLLVTSPPYMNNYHYVRNTRPQLYWLGMVSQSSQLLALEKESFGKFWQTVRQGPDVDLCFDLPSLRGRLTQLAALNPEKGHYGGRGWANYATGYLNDAYRFLEIVARHLKPGGRAVIVVGNSIIQGMEFKIDELFAQLGEMQGLIAEDIIVVRTKRVGNSIIDSAVRNGQQDHRERTTLYDAAVVLRA